MADTTYFNRIPPLIVCHNDFSSIFQHITMVNNIDRFFLVLNHTYILRNVRALKNVILKCTIIFSYF